MSYSHFFMTTASVLTIDAGAGSFGGASGGRKPNAEVRSLAKQAARYRYLLATGILDLRTRTEEARFAILSESRQRLDAMRAQAHEHNRLNGSTIFYRL